ncbi:MAG: DegT/DnrJ/EryC1/StrS family aminotransferase [Armatimonadetes bacterium]|nr:DegT/DnrJ/EryC1/StrS family aminotransferase [Armatimonadota bacterium]
MPRAAELAINGGKPAKTTPYGSGPKHIPAEKEAVCKVLDRGQLPFSRGPEVMALREKWAKMYGATHCITASSGTAAIHTAIGALGIGRGDEVITSPITDMGTLIAIMAQNAVPVFADVDPWSRNMTPESIAAKITPRTKCLLVVHLAGNPVDMPAVMKIARQHRLKVVEDLAQSYLCSYKGKLCGSYGDFGCFSLNDSKHIGAGDGGMVITNNGRLADLAELFADKCYDRSGQGRLPFMVGYNYRLNIMAAAVALEQIKRVRKLTDTRNARGEKLSALIADAPGVIPHRVLPGAKCTYWYYLLGLDFSVLKCHAVVFAQALTAEGVPNWLDTGTVLNWPLFAERRSDPWACSFSCPLYEGEVDYSLDSYPGVKTAITSQVRLQLNEWWTDKDVKDTAKAIRKVAEYYAA